jgi:hypothetical protein
MGAGMAEQVGQAHDDACASASGRICVCSCRGARHGDRHRHGRTSLLHRAGEVRVTAVTHADDARLDVTQTDATTGRQRARHPVVVTMVQTDNPQAAAQRLERALGEDRRDRPHPPAADDGPTVTHTTGPTTGPARPPADLSDDELLDEFARLSDAGDDAGLARVWEEMGRREEANRPPELPDDLSGMSDEQLADAISQVAGGTRGVERAYNELTRREEEAERRAEEARRPPADRAYVAQQATAWASLAGSPIPGFGTSTDETRERAQRAIRRAHGLDADASQAEVVQAMREDTRTDDDRTGWYIAHYRQLAEREGVDPNDRQRYGPPDDPQTRRNAEARADLVRTEQERRRAEQERRSNRDAILAGDAAPAQVRNPVATWAHIELWATSGYRGDPRGRSAQDRMDYARRRSLGLPADASDTAVNAAERADTRSIAQQRASYLGYYRQAARADGITDQSMDWERGDDDRGGTAPRTDPYPEALAPANVARPWNTWLEIRDQAIQVDGRDSATYQRYRGAMAREYGLPADARDDEISAAMRADPRTDNQRGAAYIANYRQQAEVDGVDRSDRLRHGPEDRGSARTTRSQWRETTPDQERRIDGLLAQGYDYVDAYAEVHHLDPDQLRREQAGHSAGRRAGESTDAALRRQYDEYTHLRYIEAETAVRGHLLNPEGRALADRGELDAVSLFSGTTARARRYASEDLLRWWEANGGRTTFTQFRAQVAGGRRDRAAAERTARAAAGRDFG